MATVKKEKEPRRSRELRQLREANARSNFWLKVLGFGFFGVFMTVLTQSWWVDDPVSSPTALTENLTESLPAPISAQAPQTLLNELPTPVTGNVIAAAPQAVLPATANQTAQGGWKGNSPNAVITCLNCRVAARKWSPSNSETVMLNHGDPVFRDETIGNWVAIYTKSGQLAYVPTNVITDIRPTQ